MAKEVYLIHLLYRAQERLTLSIKYRIVSILLTPFPLSLYPIVWSAGAHLPTFGVINNWEWRQTYITKHKYTIKWVILLVLYLRHSPMSLHIVAQLRCIFVLTDLRKSKR